MVRFPCHPAEFHVRLSEPPPEEHGQDPESPSDAESQGETSEATQAAAAAA